jgi:hypothetical protein
MRRGENRSERGGQEKQTFNLSKFTEEVSMAMFLLISVSRRETSAEAATAATRDCPCQSRSPVSHEVAGLMLFRRCN